MNGTSIFACAECREITSFIGSSKRSQQKKINSNANEFFSDPYDPYDPHSD